jgi:2-methylcitrate dehydratase PrpD
MTESRPDADITAQLASEVNGFGFADIPRDAVEVGKQCLLDWLGVSLAAADDPLVEIVAGVAAEDGGRPVCTLIGRGARGSVPQACLINGSMGHALDYDDVITNMGHPTVPVAPVVFALAEAGARSGRDLLTAFVAGFELEVRVALLLGPSHYRRGWHGTATFGTFGAAAAAARLLGLSVAQQSHAFGIAGTQAAGLKAVFGTMCKPLHAGKAAANGLLAARLAHRGFTSNPDILAADQGFGTTQSDALDPAAPLRPAPRGFWVRETLFKHHAACYLTHSAINAASAIVGREHPNPDDIAAIEVGVDPGHLKVCAIPRPATGLEIKFSLAMTTALALVEANTADDRLYSDATANDPALAALRDRVTVRPRQAPSPTLSSVRVEMRDGQVFEAEADCARPADDIEAQWALLGAKFRALCAPRLGTDGCDRVVSACRELDRLDDVRPLLALVAGA